MIHFPSLPALARMLVRGEALDDLLPDLQRQACEAAGASGSVLLVHNRRTCVFQARAWHGFEDLAGGVWFEDPAERRLVERAIGEATPLLASDLVRQVPALSARLDSDIALIVPLITRGDTLGVLLLALKRTTLPPGAVETIVSAAEVLIILLERVRLLRATELQRSVRSLILTFSENVPTSVDGGPALRALCEAANRAFGACRTSVWLADRTAREIVQAASSEDVGGPRIGLDEADPRLTAALHRTRADLWAPDADAPPSGEIAIVVPLRGQRRALGLLVFEGIASPLDAEPGLIESAEELGSQLSSLLENVQLLRDVLRSRRELENTFDAITDLVLVCNQHLELVNVNETFARRVGRQRHEILDRPVHEFLDPAAADWMAVAMGATGGGAPAAGEVVDTRLGGTFAVTATALPAADGEAPGLVVVARDITRQTELESEREALRARLLQSEKLAALGQFVAGIAHELNNPLQGVLGHLELVRTTREMNRPLARDLQVVFREADRAAKIVRNLLVFAGSRKLARRRLSLNAVISRAVTLRAAACRAAGIVVSRRYEEDLPRLQGDPLLLQQAFLNIIMNAEHALLAEGGRIDITTRHVRSRGTIVADIRDSGRGIGAEAISRVFEPFFTTKEVGKGTGLGLAITYGIIQEHGGSIQAANHPGGGAIFTVELPAGRERR